MIINKEYFEIKKMHFMDADCTDGRLVFFDTYMEAFFSYEIEKELLTYLRVKNREHGIKENPRKIMRYYNDFYTVQASPCIVNHYKYKNGELDFCGQIIADRFGGIVKNAFLYNGMLWIIPSEEGFCIAIIDLSRETVEYLKISENVKNNKSFRDTTCFNEKVFISYIGNSDLCCVNMIDRSIEVYSSVIPKPIEGISTKGNEIILRIKGGKEIYGLDVDERRYRMIAESEDKYEDIGKLRVLSDGNIIICPIYGNKFFYVDQKTNSIISIENKNEIHHNESMTFTIETKEYKENLYIYPWAGEKIVKISLENQTYIAKEIDFRILKENYKEYFDDKRLVGNIIREGECIQLNDYLQLL